MTRQELIGQIFNKRSYLCVGLDADMDKIPQHLRNTPDPQFEFNRQIIDATLEQCVAYKVNTAFYESQGVKGWESLVKTVSYIPDTHFRIADAKRGDIGNTAEQYAKAFFQQMNFDAITVAPYMGEDSVRPFLEHTGKWAIVLGLTSNPGSRDFEMLQTPDGLLYQQVLKKSASWGNPTNLMYVIGATRYELVGDIRKSFPEHFFLVPGVGAQGGSLEEISSKGMNKDCGLLVNASRAIIFAGSDEHFAAEATKASKAYHNEMKGFLENIAK
jgi:orotidine-5'-phosphate decarboxylase